MLPYKLEGGFHLRTEHDGKSTINHGLLFCRVGTQAENSFSRCNLAIAFRHENIAYSILQFVRSALSQYFIDPKLVFCDCQPFGILFGPDEHDRANKDRRAKEIACILILIWEIEDSLLLCGLQEGGSDQKTQPFREVLHS